MSGKSELMIFSTDLPQVVVDSAYYSEVLPQNSLGGLTVGSGTIIFNVFGSENEYLDMNDTFFEFEVRILKGTGQALDASSGHMFVNHTMHALFSDVKVLANNIIVEGGNMSYPYKAVIENMLNFDEVTRKIQLYAAGYDPSDESRKKWSGESRVVRLAGVLRIDFFNMTKYLPPGVDIKVMLTPSKSKFSIQGAREGSEPKVEFLSAKMHVRRVKVNPSVMLGHQIGFGKQNAIYHYTSGRVVSFSVPQGASNYTFEPLFPRSIMPKFVVIGLVAANAYSGDSANADPFKFSPYGVNSLGLYSNGQCLPYAKPYEISDWNTDHVTAFLKSLIHEPMHLNTNLTNGITMAQFVSGGLTLFCFNLAADSDFRIRQPVKDASLRLDMKFGSKLASAINVVIYGMFDCEVQITKDRTVITDPNVF